MRPRPARTAPASVGSSAPGLLGEVDHLAPVAGAQVEAALGEALGVDRERAAAAQVELAPGRARGRGR